MAVSSPEPRRSRTRLALLLITGAFAVMALVAYWGVLQIKKLIDAMDCRPSIAVEATGTTAKAAEAATLASQAAEAAANAAWEAKVAAAHGNEFATSGLKSDTRLNCSGSGSTHTCSYAAKACVWKK